MSVTIRRLAFAGIVLLNLASAESKADYQVTNLVSDIQGLAANTDPNLKNPWGASFSAGSPRWVSDQAGNTSTLYNGAGVPQALVVNIPTVAGGPNGPTGQVFNNNSADFVLPGGGAALFLFANLNGQISGWNGGAGTTAQTVVPATGAVYTGLAIGPVGADNILFAADTRNNKVDVFSPTFQNLNSTTYAGAFVDPNLPAGFKVFNVQNVGGTLYVTYDNTTGGNAATNGGVVATFGLDGHFIKQLISNGPGGPLQDPWGVVMAPQTFGQFGGDLLVGNKESGQINAYDPVTGAFQGLLATVTNDPTSTNNGLWSLSFGNGGGAGSPNTLFAAAGINNERDGLIVAINAVPEPSSALLAGIGGVLAFLRIRRRQRTAN
jgi:uncharacterized protein (TIGR03118 family)